MCEGSARRLNDSKLGAVCTDMAHRDKGLAAIVESHVHDAGSGAKNRQGLVLSENLRQGSVERIAVQWSQCTNCPFAIGEKDPSLVKSRTRRQTLG